MRAAWTSPGCVPLFVPWLEVADRVPLRFLIGRYFFVASRIDELLRLPCLPFLRPKLARLRWPHAASDRLRDDSAAPSSVVFATSFTSCIILCPEPASTRACRLTNSVW